MFSFDTIEFSTTQVKEEIENDKHHYIAICLIIASHSTDYDKMAFLWRSYMNTDSRIKSYLLYCNPNISSDILITTDEIIYKNEEGYVPGILLKTLAGIHVANRYFSYDYIIRTNISSVFHFNRVIDFLNNQSKQNFVYGPPAYTNLIENEPQKKNIQINTIKQLVPQENYSKHFLFYQRIYNNLHGAGYIISKDVSQKLIEIISKTPIDDFAFLFIDDSAITILLNIFIKHTDILYTDKHIYVPFKTNDIDNIKNNKYLFHFRNQHLGLGYKNRDIDISLMREQIQLCYNFI
jgi:GR25 family glycosyltransferase involved in LPS biosynthesis